MRIRVFLVLLCALGVLAIGSSPRYLEELRIGGGYGESEDGGADLDKQGNISTDGDVVCGDVWAKDGAVTAGQDGAQRGILTAWNQAGGNAPGVLKLCTADNSLSYVFAANDGSGLRISNTLPTGDTAGAWPTAGKLRGSGSTTDAVDLGTAEVAGTLPASSVGNGLTDTQVNDNLTITAGVINNTSIGATTASMGRFTTLTATGVLATVTITTFTADDTTPSVSAGNVYKVPNTWTAGHDIADFDSGETGQQIVVIGGDSDCTVTDGGHLKLCGDWTASANDTLCLVYDGTDWFEVSRSNN